jgi:hypothetical protein
MKAESEFAYDGKEDMESRVKDALSGVEVSAREPMMSTPAILQNLHPYKASHDEGMLSNAEFQANTMLKAVPARMLLSSPLDRAGMLYGLTLAFLDANSEVHYIACDMVKDTASKNLFEQRIIGVSQEMALAFATEYGKDAPKTEPTQAKAVPTSAAGVSAPQANAAPVVGDDAAKKEDKPAERLAINRPMVSSKDNTPKNATNT